MSVVKTIDQITEWVQKNICNQIELKSPPNDDAEDAKEDSGYNEQYILAHPTAFAMYLPDRERAAPKNVGPCPSICVQPIQGRETQNDGTMKIRLGLTIWNPGDHGLDFFNPSKDGDDTFRQWNDEEAMEHYKRRGDGWKDAWNFLDLAIRTVGSTSSIAGLRIKLEDGIEYGPYTEQDDIVDYYPFWFAWLSFSIEYSALRNNTAIESML